MQVGGLGPTGCLAPGTMFVPTFYVSGENNTKDAIRLQKNAVSIMIGTSLGGIALGIGIGILSYILFIRIRRRRQRSPSQNYFASQHFSSTKPYKAPSIVPSTITPSSSSSTIPLQQPPPLPVFQPAPSIPNSSDSSRTYSYSSSSNSTLMHSNRASRTTHVLLEPLRPNSQSRPLPSPTIASSEAGSAQECFQLDTKRPPLPDDVPSSVPSSSHTRLPPTHSRSPTYVQNPHSVFVIHETEVVDVPPEYGRHTDDTSCTPSIISSGRVPVRF